MDSKKIKLKVKLGSENEFTVEVNSTATVGELKQAIEAVNGSKASDQKLIFKGLCFNKLFQSYLLLFTGKILKDNEALNALKVEDGSTLHMVCSF